MAGRGDSPEKRIQPAYHFWWFYAADGWPPPNWRWADIRSDGKRAREKGNCMAIQKRQAKQSSVRISRRKPVLVGSGEYTYEWIEPWATLPPGRKFGNTHAVQETADGRIIIHHAGQDSTAIFDARGQFIEAWGGATYAGTGHGMDLRREHGAEVLYLAPTSLHKVVKTDLRGHVLLTLEYPQAARDRSGQPCYAGPEEYVPTFTAFAPNGDFYITDGYGQGWVHRYDAEGRYVQSFGGKGEGPDQTNCPHGIFCDTRRPERPMIVVADRGHHRLQYFTLDGKLDHLVTNDTPAQNEDDTGRLRLPCHFSVRNGLLLIPDLRGRVTILDRDNQVVAHLGDNPNAAQRANNGVPAADLTPGHFCCPHGATWDHEGNIYVAEWLPYGRVTKLRHVGG